MNASIHNNETSKITRLIVGLTEVKPKLKTNVSQSLCHNDDDGQTVTFKKGPRGNVESF